MPAPTGTVTPQPLIAPLPAPLRPDWGQPVEFETSWLTDVEQAQLTLAEERIARRTRPLRRQRFFHTTMSRVALGEALATLNLSQTKSIPVPVYPDTVLLTASTSIGSTALTVTSTLYRRFQVGQRALIATFDFAAWEYVTITAVGPTTLTLGGSGTSVAWPAGRLLVFPCFDSQIALSHKMSLQSAHITQGTLSFSELAGNSTLLHSWDGTLPSPFVTYNGAPIFPFDINFEGPELEIIRIGEEKKSGVASIVTVYGEASTHNFDQPLRLFDREDFWNLLRFFDSVRGRKGMFWGLTPSVPLAITAIDAGGAFIVSKLLSLDANAVPYRYVAIHSGAYGIQIAQIHTTPGIGLSNVGGQTIIVFQAALSPVPILPDIKRITFAIPARLTSDSMKESWRSTTIVDVSLPFFELLSEISIGVSDI